MKKKKKLKNEYFLLPSEHRPTDRPRHEDRRKSFCLLRLVS